MKVKLFLLISLCIASVVFYACSTESNANTDENAAVKTEQSEDIDSSSSADSIAIAYDIYGIEHDFSEWIGKQPTVVNFWGTWCPPCRREIPDLVRLYQEYKPKGVEIVSVAVKDSPTKVKNYIEQANMTWVMLMAAQPHVDIFKLSGSVPTTIFYDRKGNEVARYVGMRNYDTFKESFDLIAGS